MAKVKLTWEYLKSADEITRFMRTIGCEKEYTEIKELQAKLAEVRRRNEAKFIAAFLKAGKRPKAGCTFAFSYIYGQFGVADDKPLTSGDRDPEGDSVFSLPAKTTRRK